MLGHLFSRARFRLNRIAHPDQRFFFLVTLFTFPLPSFELRRFLFDHRDAFPIEANCCEPPFGRLFLSLLVGMPWLRGWLWLRG